jgi:hypothetical protein
LLADATAWWDADTILAYVAAARSAAAGGLEMQAFESWTQCALPEADRLDPISNGQVFANPEAEHMPGD